MSLRLDAYIRVSDTGGRSTDDASLQGPPQQRAAIERWAAGTGVEIAEWHEDLDQSGTKLSRPSFDAMMERIRTGQTGGVVVARIDRLSRASVIDALRTVEQIHEWGGKVNAADLGTDPGGYMGEMLMTLMLALARMEIRRIEDNWDQSQAAAVARGVHIGNAPFGYRKIPKGEADTGCLVVDRGEANIVVGLFERKVGGATWLELARWLDSAVPKAGGRKWGRNTVRGMIECRTYLGEISHGKHVNPTGTDPIVTPALWRRAQVAPGRRTPRGGYLLTGLVRCAGCGRRMRATSGGTKKVSTYSCQTAECKLRYTTVTVDRLDAEVVDQFFAALGELRAEAVDDDAIEEAEAEVRRLTEEVETRAMVAPAHPSAVAAHGTALKQAEGALIEAEDHLAHLVAARTAVGPDVLVLAEAWPDMPIADRRQLLEAAIAAVLVARASVRNIHAPVAERIRVVFKSDAPDGLVDNGRSGIIRSWTWEPESAVVAA
jgi:DNA invertase Pin-like site-specific DNA recombinase